MAINKGNIKTSVNYNLEAQKPLDARSVRPTKADLYKKESWSYDGDSVYIYNGMLVYVEDEKKTYCLVDETKYNEASGWELVGTGASSGGGSDITVDTAMSDSSTNPVQNRVVKKYVDDAINNIPPQEPTVDVIDNLDSTDTEAALSANQGRILNEKIEAVANEATKIFNVKGSCKYSELPTTNNAVGDVYNITDSFTIGSENYPAGTNVVWDGANWDALGGSIDLSAYATTETVVAMVQEETDRARGAETRIQKEITTIKVNVANKVTKEDGKGLSDENFTSALKKKLDAFKNPEDYALQTQIESLQSQLDALTNDDSIDEVIAKYEELKAFLEGLGNDEYGAFIEEISNQIAELGKGLTDANKRIDSVEERLEDLASEIVIDEKEVYIGDDEPADAKIWIDTDEEYEGGGGTTTEGAKVYTIYPEPNEGQIKLNKAAFDSLSAKEDAVYYVSLNINGLERSVLISTPYIVSNLAFFVTAMTSTIYEGASDLTTISIVMSGDGAIMSYTKDEGTMPTITKVQEMIAASVGDIKTAIVAINGEEV